MAGKRAAEEKANQHQPQQEGAQVTCSAKSQTSQAKAAAAAAATKLERFARTSLSPVKSQQSAQIGASTVRKSQGSGQASALASPTVAPHTKEQGAGKLDITSAETVIKKPQHRRDKYGGGP